MRLPILIALLACLALGNRAAAAADKLLVFVGTYTGRGSEGIYACELDASSGAIKPLGVTTGVKNPSFLAIHPNQKLLYAVSEVADFASTNGGAVTAFSIDAATGRLDQLNAQPSGGGGPCHLVVDKTGRAVLVANYGGGSVASLPIDADGRLRPPASVIQHHGSSVNPGRQEGPHAHSINVSPDDRFAVSADLGLDKLLVYKLDAAQATLAPNDPPSTSVAPGSGPRHFAFSPNGRFAYVINELASTVTAFKYDESAGRLTSIQTISTLPKDFKGDNTTAEVQVHPSGKFLYGSNRGHNSIAAFKIDPATGELAVIGHTPSGGRTPRNFGIEPGGKYLLAANQDSDSIHVLAIDQATGALAPTGHSVAVPMPVCVKFLPRP